MADTSDSSSNGGGSASDGMKQKKVVHKYYATVYQTERDVVGTKANVTRSRIQSIGGQEPMQGEEECEASSSQGIVPSQENGNDPQMPAATTTAGERPPTKRRRKGHRRSSRPAAEDKSTARILPECQPGTSGMSQQLVRRTVPKEIRSEEAGICPTSNNDSVPPDRSGSLASNQDEPHETAEETARRIFKSELRRMRLEGRVAVCLNGQNYSEASKILKQLRSGSTDKCYEIHSLLLIAECDIMNDNHRGAVQNTEKLSQMLQSLRPPVKDIIQSGKDYQEDGEYVKAFLLFYSAEKMAECDENAGVGEMVAAIQMCVERIKQIVESTYDREFVDITGNREYYGVYGTLMIHSSSHVNRQRFSLRKVTTGHMIPALAEIADRVKQIETQGCKEAILGQAWCLHDTGICYKRCKMYDDCEEVFEAAVKLMESQLKEDVKKCQAYTQCLLEAAFSCHMLKKSQSAHAYLKLVSEAIKKVDDWQSRAVQKDATAQLRTIEAMLENKRKVNESILHEDFEYSD